jgi:DNA modification methylase
MNTKMLQGDCVEVMKTLPNDSVDMVFTSPPYNCGKGKMYEHYSDDLSDEQYFQLLHKSLTECLRVCKGLVFFNLNFMNTNRGTILRWLAYDNWALKDIVVWDKLNCQPPIGNIFGKRCEFIFVFAKTDVEINNFKENKAKNYKTIFGNWLSNICQISIKQDKLDSSIHRAGFPTSLPRVFIDMYTKKDETVLDPFAGCGTTGVACIDLGRKFIGIELTSEYYQVAEKRFNNTQESLF